MQRSRKNLEFQHGISDPNPTKNENFDEDPGNKPDGNGHEPFKQAPCPPVGRSLIGTISQIRKERSDRDGCIRDYRVVWPRSHGSMPPGISTNKGCG